MMKFTAEKINIDLELTTLEGEEENINPKISLSSESAMNTMEQWKNIELEYKEEKIKIIAEQLAIVYPKPSDWFLKNLDVKTMNDILIFVAQAMGGIRKNEVSSN